MAETYCAIVSACTAELDIVRVIAVLGPYASFGEAYKAGEKEVLRHKVGETGEEREVSIEFDPVTMTVPTIQAQATPAEGGGT